MSANVGLATPRGSGTSGYIQRNLSALRPKPQASVSVQAPILRVPNSEILRHDRLRAIEVLVAKLQDKLEQEDKPDDEIETECDAYRSRLIQELDEGRQREDRGRVKGYKVHEAAEAKGRESEKLRKALGLKPRDDTVHPMARERGVEKTGGATADTVVVEPNGGQNDDQHVRTEEQGRDERRSTSPRRKRQAMDREARTERRRSTSRDRRRTSPVAKKSRTREHAVRSKSPNRRGGRPDPKYRVRSASPRRRQRRRDQSRSSSSSYSSDSRSRSRSRSKSRDRQRYRRSS